MKTVRAGSPVSEISASSGRPVTVVDDAPDMDGLQLRFEAGGARLFVFSGVCKVCVCVVVVRVCVGGYTHGGLSGGKDVCVRDALRKRRSGG